MNKINVLQFITPTGLYGAEMWILALAKNLDPQKINCQLAVTLESENHDIEIYKRFSLLGLNAYQIKMRGRFDPLCIIRLYKLIRQKKIDIIHTHGYKSDILGLTAAKLTGIKAVSTPHGFEHTTDLKLRFFIRLGSFAFKYFDRVAPLSEELKADIERFNVNHDKIQLIINGVDIEEIESERKKCISGLIFNPHEKKIGYVGQMIERKNLGELINTFDLLYKEYKNIRLILIGDGPERENLEKMTKELKSNSQIEFSGYRKDRLKFMKELDIFCMTSYLEGIPRCMMEAMAMGIPVAAYDIPGVDKLIIHEKTGLTAKFGKRDDLKECWKRLLFDEKFSKQIALNARKHITENFSAKRMAEEYTGLYNEIMKNT